MSKGEHTIMFSLEDFRMRLTVSPVYFYLSLKRSSFSSKSGEDRTIHLFLNHREFGQDVRDKRFLGK